MTIYLTFYKFLVHLKLLTCKTNMVKLNQKMYEVYELWKHKFLFGLGWGGYRTVFFKVKLIFRAVNFYVNVSSLSVGPATNGNCKRREMGGDPGWSSHKVIRMVWAAMHHCISHDHPAGPPVVLITFEGKCHTELNSLVLGTSYTWVFVIHLGDQYFIHLC